MTATDQRLAVALSTSGPITAQDPRTAERMVGIVARCAVEVVRAQRPSSTMARMVTPEILDMLERRASLTRRLKGLAPGTTSREVAAQVVLSGIRTCIVNDRVVEASAVVREPGRARFLAMRWELRHSGWRVTVLEIG